MYNDSINQSCHYAGGHSPSRVEQKSRAEHIRWGFTLVELMIAITISAGLLLGGRLILEQISTAEHTIMEGNTQHDTALVHTKLLHSVVRNLEIGTDSLTTFSGDAHSVRFTSWCIDANFKQMRCSVHLVLDTLLTVITSTGPPIAMLRRLAGGHLLYLGDARNGGQWYRSWGTRLAAPLAIGLIAGTDTTVLRIGERE